MPGAPSERLYTRIRSEVGRSGPLGAATDSGTLGNGIVQPGQQAGHLDP